MSPDAENRLAYELTALVLERTVPNELAILDQVAEDYFADAEAVLDPKRRDDPLGFGVDISLLAPYVLAVAVPAVQYLATILMDGATEAATGEVADRVRGMFRRQSGPPVVLPGDGLTDEQMRTVHVATRDRARALGLPPDQSQILADAVVGSLITKG